MKFLSPKNTLFLINKAKIWLFILMCASFLYGTYLAIFASPPDYQQGETVRIMYVHVPAAWMSLIIYSIMALSSAGFVIWVSPIANEIAKCSSYIGATFAFIALVTGSLWGKPMWGTWWVWDARLTSMAILFFFYVGYILLINSVTDNSSKAPAFLAILGFINVPIVKFSVDIWNSLHQPASIIKLKGPSIHSSMLKPLLVMILASFIYYFWILAIKLKTSIIEHKCERIQNRLINKG